MNYKYKFSVITAVYNVEQFVAETIESLIAQDIGFKNIQLILVNDGSTDNSGKICDEYAAKYPHNITVIHKENGGVSSARNMGLDLIEGKYVNFLDADDLLTPETMNEVWSFFETHYSETDVVSIPLFFFDGQTGRHILNYKFGNNNRVINLNDEINAIQLSMASTFIKVEELNGLSFDTRLAYAEDAQLLQTILIKKQSLGAVSSAKYMYRRRQVGLASAIQSSHSNPKWYLPYMLYFQKATVDHCLSTLGFVPEFVQYTLMYDLQFRIKLKEIPEEIMTEEEKKEYFSVMQYVLNAIDDEIIYMQRNMWREHKFFAYCLKYGKAPDFNVVEDDIELVYNENSKLFLSNSSVEIEFIKIDGNKLKTEGTISFYNLPYKSFAVKASVNSKIIDCDILPQKATVKALGYEVLNSHKFSFSIKTNQLDKNNKIKILLQINGTNIVIHRYVFKGFAPFDATVKKSYCYDNGWMVSYKNEAIHIIKSNPIKHFAYEAAFLCHLIRSKRNRIKRAAIFRFAYHLIKPFRRKPVWIINDRASKAGDNGEAFFRYMVTNHKEIDTRYVIQGDSDDYEKMCQIGPTLKKDSYKHKLWLLLSECIISSHAEREIFNPFGKNFVAYRDILSKKKIVFLQHGVIVNDVSNWLNKYNKNFSGFVTSSKLEYASIVNGNYYYNKDQVWLTGLPRFDRLEDRNKKYITIMPTWRRYLLNKWDKDTDTWSLLPEFYTSTFFNFYNGLLNDKRLLTAANKHGYKLRFLPHPTLQPHIDLFEKNNGVEFLDKTITYSSIYSESSLVVTDYSSAVFDFSYLRKPIIYCHFDAEEFFNGEHICTKGYFDYERDGFGEVEYDLESTVDRIIEYMENGCQLKDKYRERIDNFFAFNDKNNCQRVYEKIME